MRLHYTYDERNDCFKFCVDLNISREIRDQVPIHNIHRCKAIGTDKDEYTVSGEIKIAIEISQAFSVSVLNRLEVCDIEMQTLPGIHLLRAFIAAYL